MEKKLLGETRRDAINSLQDQLGPVTPRPLAEQTFWKLARQGKITLDENGHYLIEADVTEKSMRDTALDTVNQEENNRSRARVRSSVRHFNINHKNMHQARISTSWKAKMMSSMKTSFAPTLSGAEAFKGAGDVPDDE